MGAIPVYVDTDISLGTPRAEIDDGAALIMLLRSPEVDVRGIGTVQGNVAAPQAAHNASNLLARLDREDISVGVGADQPLVSDPNWSAWLQKWRAQYGPTPASAARLDGPSAVELLIEIVRSAPGQVTVVALGPLTNLALALRKEPDLQRWVREVIAMGGSFNRENKPAEFNVRCDPEAASIVFGAEWRLRLLGLEVTRQALFSRDDFANLPSDDPALTLLKEQAVEWIDVVEAQGWEKGGCALHDAVAVAALLDESLIAFSEAEVDVETETGPRRGQTAVGPAERIASLQKPRVAIQIELIRCREFIWERLNGRS